MLHFINQTRRPFVIRKIDNVLDMSEDDPISLPSINMVELSRNQDELCEAVVHKLEETEDMEFKVAPGRTSKLQISVPDMTTLYEVVERDESCNANAALAKVFLRENGLVASEYYYPKSVIFIIADIESDPVSIEYESEELTATAKGDDYKSAPVYIGAVLHAPETKLKITAIFCSCGKWDKIPENTFIRVSSEKKLKFATIPKKKEDRTFTINALIRCDGEGNPIEDRKREPRSNNKKKNNGGGSNSGGNKKSKKNKRRGRMESISNLINKAGTVSQ